ncbi:MAG: transcriptional regulator [Methanomassiliicoccaceae archaeon]|nr:transcriptional regulator [Methanomassiliicoccaceae archaeon]
MNYDDLADEFLRSLQLIRKAGKQNVIQEGVRGEAFVLHYIREMHSGIIPGEISEAMGASSARVAAVLNSLESKGLITREIDSDDRRRIIVRLTEKGTEHAEEHRRDRIGMMKSILMMLGDEDAAEYVRITRKLAASLSEIKRQQ